MPSLDLSTDRPGRRPPRNDRGARRPRSLVVCALLLAAGISPAAADGPEPWVLADGRITARVHAWGAACGERPTDAEHRPGAHYVRRELALLPVDDAPPIFGPGICRAFIPAVDVREMLHGADAVCGASDGSTARFALRQPDADTLTVVQQVRRTPGEGCVADVIGTWTLRRPDAPAPNTKPARDGSQAALAPVPPPVLAPDPVTVPPRVVVEASARALPPPPLRLTHSRRLLLALSGLLVLLGVVGLIRHARRPG